jgi:perosamine synthetase
MTAIAVPTTTRASGVPTEAPPLPAFVALCVPAIHGNEWAYVKDCLDTGWVSSVGRYVERFERVVAKAVGAHHGVATVNGTSALHVALLVAGVRPDDEVLVSTLTFIAPVNAIRYLGAWPVLVDAEAEFAQMDVQRVADFLAHGCRWQDGALRNRVTGRRVRAILPVHVLGHPVDAAPLRELATRYELAFVEDASEGFGALYRGEPVGGLGDVACLSFNGNKLVTTGGGGMLLTDDEALARHARHLTTQAKDDPVEFVHDEIGYNYRLTNVLAAIGVAQMEHFPAYVATKRAIAARYAAAFAGVPGITPLGEAPWARSTYWMYTVRVDPAAYGATARALHAALAARRIETRPLWQPMHRSPAHRGAQALGGEVADAWNATALCLPCSVGLTEEDQQRVIDGVIDGAIAGVMDGAALEAH